ncbi:adenylosuccinate synthetase [Nocardia sp. CDC153]|uniref:adenylosuccinate synthetase n=1 Tax=Nocardia sp. CDC153 TaxID=3112167 RepID=UPI002DBACD42|nr:adenylosuccinate synthetase [Nocardia sp. CDC153]MEC3953456.1 adenylosuccinate synthetase [Nocardia sp. CDC153]
MFGDNHLIVVDLGFGDAGKGATVDWLCSPAAGLDVAAVVRFNGGAQAAHNVLTHGRHHTFRQFGSGTLSRVPTLLSRHMLVEPLALAAEARELAALGVADPLSLLYVDERALLTTPIHGAANRCREDARGTSRHGSCGIGIGETASYALDHDAPRVADCLRPEVLRRKLIALEAHYAPLLADGRHRYDPVDELVAAYTAFADAVAILPGDQLAGFARSGRLVFEGAQGVLLDEWRGTHPYTTWSTVEPRNARAMLARIGAPGYVLGVTRAYMTRHGAGPFPTEDARLSIPERHNGTGEYQGGFRRGHLDPLLLRYAIEACGGIDGLAVNHLDAVGAHRTAADGNHTGGEIRTATGYLTPDGCVDRLTCGAWQDLDHQQTLTDLLTTATPALADLPADVPAYLETALGAPVVLTGHGPDRADRRIRIAAEA